MAHKRAPPTRWKSTSIMVDIETGEIIQPEDAYKYTKLNKEIFHHGKGHVITRDIQWNCKRSQQLNIFTD